MIENSYLNLTTAEASVYVYNQGKEDYAVNFAQLTQKDGSFIVVKEKAENFSFEMREENQFLSVEKVAFQK